MTEKVSLIPDNSFSAKLSFRFARKLRYGLRCIREVSDETISGDLIFSLSLSLCLSITDLDNVGRCQTRVWIAKSSSQSGRCTCPSSPQSHPVIMAALGHQQRTPPLSSRNSMGLGSKTWTSFSVTLSGAEDDARVTRLDGRPRACLRRPSAPRPTGSFVRRRGAQSRAR